MIPGLLLARISLLFVYGRRYIVKTAAHRTRHSSTKVSGDRLYGRHRRPRPPLKKLFVRNT